MNRNTLGRWLLVCVGCVGATLLASPGALLAAEKEELTRGTVEFSTAASFTNFKSEGDDSYTIVNLPLRVGYFATPHLSIEGELALSYIGLGGEGDDNSVGALVSGHLLYHFQPAGRTTPFLLAGAGVGNGVEFFGVVGDAHTTIKAFHAGAGIKTFLGRRAAVRLEYRFTHATGSDNADPFRDDTRVNTHRVFVGISVFHK